MAKKTAPDRTVCRNRKATHRFHILEKIECGIALVGTEVKSLRERAASIGRSHWWFGDVRVAFEWPSRIEAVTLDEVRDAFETYVSRATPVRVYLRPQRVPLMVRLFGWLYPLVN